MASTPTDRVAAGAEGNTASERLSDPHWETEMQVTFDSAELASFFDGFDPLEVIAAGAPEPQNDG